MKVPPTVKTSLSPGSRVVTEYFNKAGPDSVPGQAGFPDHRLRLHDLHRQQRAAAGGDLRRGRGGRSGCLFGAVGQPKFRGRINPHVKANYLASPPLVVAYALAGTMDINIMDEADRQERDGKTGLSPRHLAHPAGSHTTPSIPACRPRCSRKNTATSPTATTSGTQIPVKGGELFNWDEQSTYIQEPPFFTNHRPSPATINAIHGAKSAGDGRRQRDHRSHFPRRRHQERTARPENSCWKTA